MSDLISEQSQTGKEMGALLPSVPDRAFKGEGYDSHPFRGGSGRGC
jgi:hypothetical protein